ncbi:hypothetical protein BDV18DRAFT_146747 [Aspergillus unguis]
MATVDLIIVGAGLHGLIMAKTYLEVHPASNILVVDESASIGGTWARERLYPGLKTNNVFGSYELRDFPMVPGKYGTKGDVNGHIPGEVVHVYWADVAEHYGITECLRLRTRVVEANSNEQGVWSVCLQSLDSGRETVLGKRLVIATGLTSKPNIPSIPGSETFNRPVIHSKQLRQQASTLSQCKRVVVVGGNKSAWDTCYTAARNGAQVDMVIRPSGGGPSYLWPRRFSFGPFKTSLAKLSLTRFFALLDPAPFGNGPFSWLKRFLHRAVLGQLLVRFFWTFLDSLIRRINGYNTHPELKKLEPWTTPFWMGNSLGIHNYETSWFDLVREGKINIHIADLAAVSDGKVHLANGDMLDADALVLCTGWATDIPVRLDIPEIDAGEAKEAVRTVYESIPYLSNMPRRTPNAPGYENFATSKSSPLLYRDILPVQERFMQQKNLAFIGMSISIQAVPVAQAQALWITALFAGKLHLGQERIMRTAVLDRKYGEIRRPHETGGLAGRHGDFVFDSLPYIDELLDDLGIECKRKRNWWRELTEAYSANDYRGIVQEWVNKK